MSKKKAHIVLILAEVLALFALWLGYDAINKVIADIAASAEMVSFNNRVGFLVFAVGFPIIHIFSICYYYRWHRFLEKKAALVNLSCIILGIALFASALLISTSMRTYVERAGYLHCPEADKRMSFTTHLMYTKNDEICSQLVEEKRKRRR